MSEPPPSVVLLAKFRAATSGVAGAMSTGRSKNCDVRYRAFVAKNSVLARCRRVGAFVADVEREDAIRQRITDVKNAGRHPVEDHAARVTTSGFADSAASVLMPAIGVNEPGGASWSTPFCTCTC